MNTISLQQIKKEAKRLIKLSKEGDFSSENGLRILSLSDAQEVMARLKGYPNWHALTKSISDQSEQPASTDEDAHIVDEQVWTEEDLIRLKSMLEPRHRAKMGHIFECAESIDSLIKYRLGTTSPARTAHLGSKSKYILNRVLGRSEPVNIFIPESILIQGAFSSGAAKTMTNLLEEHAMNDQRVVLLDPNMDSSLLWHMKAAYPDRPLRAIVLEKAPGRITNSIDPFEVLISGFLFDLLVEKKIDRNPENDVWVGRAKLLLTGVEDSLIHWRQRHPSLVIDVGFLRKVLTLEGLLSLQLVSPSSSLRKFLNDLPGLVVTEQNSVMKEVKAYSQTQVLQFLTMQTSRIMDTLDNLYAAGVFSVTPTLTWDEVMLEPATTVFFLQGVNNTDQCDHHYSIMTSLVKNYLTNRMFTTRHQMASEYPSTLICFRDPDELIMRSIAPVFAQARSLNIKSMVLTKEVSDSIGQNSLWTNSKLKIILEQDLAGSEWVVKKLFSDTPVHQLNKLVKDMMILSPGEAFLISESSISAVKIEYREVDIRRPNLSLAMGVPKYMIN